MSDFMSIFQPGLEYVRQQRDLDKILIVEADKGAPGPKPLDLESGSVTITLPPETVPPPSLSPGGSPSAD
ncbi:hypothetical protein H5399_04860 [Tessaracoccus sp. MC1627]|uniref:DUF6191 domain-containing protein n=1 Tax=Tessaracoccus sp. MC1627 TaxID=2760312 RepID=UPI0016012A40|nr:hypothetical protein [Tessaracoccus sp. MC1627]